MAGRSTVRTPSPSRHLLVPRQEPRPRCLVLVQVAVLYEDDSFVERPKCKFDEGTQRGRSGLCSRVVVPDAENRACRVAGVHDVEVAAAVCEKRQPGSRLRVRPLVRQRVLQRERVETWQNVHQPERPACGLPIPGGEPLQHRHYRL